MDNDVFLYASDTPDHYVNDTVRQEKIGQWREAVVHLLGDSVPAAILGEAVALLWAGSAVQAVTLRVCDMLPLPTFDESTVEAVLPDGKVITPGKRGRRSEAMQAALDEAMQAAISAWRQDVELPARMAAKRKAAAIVADVCTALDMIAESPAEFV